MLNLVAIKAAMTELGLTQAAVAQACEVSKEATSNWLAGEAIPRPSKLTRLAKVLRVSVEQLLETEEDFAEPVFAYRTKQNRAVSGDSKASAEELSRHLQQLLPLIDARSEFAPRQVLDPVVEEEHVRRVANTVRASAGLGAADPISMAQVVQLFHEFGAFLVPVLWGLNKEKHENALSVYLPETKASFVVFNLGCKQDDIKYWLAHEYGHCLSLHKLRDKPAEDYAELFGHHLVFPVAAAEACFVELSRHRSPNAKLAAAQACASFYGISIVTVLKSVDSVALGNTGAKTGLLKDSFWASWKLGRARVPSVAMSLFGTDTPSQKDYIKAAEDVYGSRVLNALAQFQRIEGRNPAFIANTLMVGLGDAIKLSQELWHKEMATDLPSAAVH